MPLVALLELSDCSCAVYLHRLKQALATAPLPMLMANMTLTSSPSGPAAEECELPDLQPPTTVSLQYILL